MHYQRVYSGFQAGPHAHRKSRQLLITSARKSGKRKNGMAVKGTERIEELVVCGKPLVEVILRPNVVMN